MNSFKQWPNIFQFIKSNSAYKIFSVFLCMPFFYPFKFFPGYIFPVIKTYINTKKEIIRQFMRLFAIEFFVFIFIIIAQRRNITEHSGSSWKTSGSFAVKELFICKTGFNHYSIVFIFYKS